MSCSGCSPFRVLSHLSPCAIAMLPLLTHSGPAPDKPQFPLVDAIVQSRCSGSPPVTSSIDDSDVALVVATSPSSDSDLSGAL
ncbi:hypothetical protein F4781DRAFT_398081 [Annulohypoxylon bovei var. microspora]|nr:hypothetical protein F4781DRAFT_398081 [Annulohypoxylon bovei var. microspora]